LGRVDDFTDSHFQATIDFVKKTTDDQTWVELTYGFLLSNDAVAKLVKDGSAKYALDVACSETVYRQVFICEGDFGGLDFKSGELYGKVSVDPLIVVQTIVEGFHSDDLHEEYADGCFTLYPGDTIAVGERAIRFIEFNKLKFESLVKIETNTDLAPGIYDISVCDDVIVIYMSEAFRKVWESIKGEGDKGALLAMSVYKDCVLAALHYMSHKDSAEGGQYRWERALEQKIASSGLSPVTERMDMCDLNKLAQLLVANLGVKKLLQDV
jgi:hypothetical protein